MDYQALEALVASNRGSGINPDSSDGFSWTGTNQLSIFLSGSESFRFAKTGTLLAGGDPAISWISDPDTMVRRQGANVIEFRAGGNDVLRVGSAAAYLEKGYLDFEDEFADQADPDAPSANFGRLYIRDNGSAKTQLCVRFATGAIQVLATEP